MFRQVLTEATTATSGAPISPAAGGAGRFLVQLITPGWGSSGYYSPEVLEAAAKAKVFPAGLQMYLDHEQLDGSGLDLHGNRSVKDVSAVLEGDATWNGEALVAIATVFGPYRDALSHMAESIGVSIRASADVTFGEAEGKQGTIVNELVEGYSCDFVTRAGRGGKILQVIESANDKIREAAEAREASLKLLRESRNVGQWIESRLHLSVTCLADDMYGDGYLTREERIALSSAVGDGLTAFTASLEKSAPQLFQRDLWDDPDVIAYQVDEATRNVPSNPAGRNNNPKEPNMGTIQVDEAEYSRVTEAAGRVRTLESERDSAIQRAETVESERDTERARADAAEARIAESDRDKTIARVLTEAITAANGIPLNEFERTGVAARAVTNDQGAVDESATRTAFDTALATIAESRGHGRPRGLGGPIPGEQQESTKDLLAELDAVSESAFGSQGLTIVKEA